MEQQIITIAQEGSPQSLHLLVCDGQKLPNMLHALQTVSKVWFTELKEVPAETASLALEEAVSKEAANDAVPSPALNFGALTTKNVWVILRVFSHKASAVLRSAAVQIMCARTNRCHRNFRLWLVVHPCLFSKLPRLVLHMSGTPTTGMWRALHCDGPEPEIREGQLEYFIEYEAADLAVAQGPIAELQESVFNCDPSITLLKYDPDLGDGVIYMRLMRDALKFNWVVHTLDMWKSHAGDIIGACLVAVLHSSRKLQKICLEGCSLTDVGMTQLASALRTNPYVKELSLSRNPGIGDIGLMALATALSSDSECTIHTLNLSHNNSLYTEEKQWQTDALNELWSAMGSNPHLRNVNLAECGLQPMDLQQASVRWLKQNNALEVLSLEDNALGDVAAALVLDNVGGIKELNLAHTGISAAGFRAVGLALSRKTPLAWLSLDSNNAMLVRPIDDLETNPCLHDLSDEMREILLHNKSDAVKFMLESLTTNYQLKHISCARVNIGDWGVSKIVDLLVLGNCGITSIDISGNCNIEEESSHKVKELLLGGYYETAEDAMEPTHAETLSLAGNATSIGERALLAMYHNKWLKHLNVSDMNLTDAMLQPLAEGIVKNKSLCLESIALGRNFFFVYGIQNIATFAQFSKTLTAIDLSYTWGTFTNEAGRVSSLSQSREGGMYYMQPLINLLKQKEPEVTLTTLDLSGNDISDQVVKAFATAMVNNTTFKQLLLYDNPLITEETHQLDPQRLLIQTDVDKFKKRGLL